MITANPDYDAWLHFEEEERKALEIEHLIELESEKPCYNPYLIENIVEALCNLSQEDEEKLQGRLHSMSDGWYDDDIIGDVIQHSILFQEKRIKENVMKGNLQ